MEEEQPKHIFAAFCFAMFVIDLIAGINYLYERNSNAFFNVGMSFVWLFAALKGRNIWVDRLGWIIWGIFSFTPDMVDGR